MPSIGRVSRSRLTRIRIPVEGNTASVSVVEWSVLKMKPKSNVVHFFIFMFFVIIVRQEEDEEDDDEEGLVVEKQRQKGRDL